MQHEAFANIEDFGGADTATPPHRPSRAGQDEPYQNYVLGKAYDEMFAPYGALDSRIATLPLEELNRRQQACEQSFLHQRGNKDRSGADATHAWVETYFPSLGWLGFDPTNNIQAGERHVRAAVGRDYSDVPPTRGTYKGMAESELSISVGIEPTQAPVRHEDFLKVARPMTSPATHSMPERLYHHQQQQQQQQ